ncbi:hypothetical protein [Pyramidobacter piscolens]|uniref:hypothetical protein n=1 Tax=Pyramidobacter piscolens TaxID=638849 RepID=UPI001FCB4B80|nr:hypothetical protein [Pyramidobacter piscolens]BDF77888.1 hypothetical protein CE91St28_06820 [Pyramidobacter piscolens]BDF78673.1 hypothetical protein CE91St28_14670 [Pyramidobacter piscolens]
MGVGKQIFVVDTATGQVYIAGNLFVQSADDAGDSWIVGEMISASSVIQLADGAIVLDGINGRITVFDSSNHSNGNFIRIENGFVKQYENFVLRRQLVNLETGIAYNGKWQNLLGRYEKTPVVLVSPYVMNTYTPEESAQGQHLNMRVDRIEALGNGQYRFLPYATLMTENVEREGQPPPQLFSWGHGFDGDLLLAPTDWIGGSVENVSCTTNSITIKGRVRVDVTAEFRVPCVMWETYHQNRYVSVIARWRAKYRKGNNAWQYSDYVTKTIPASQALIPQVNSVTFILDSGTYEVCFEWNCYLKKPVEFGGDNEGREVWFKITSVHLSAASIETLATGSVSYIAVGE